MNPQMFRACFLMLRYRITRCPKTIQGYSSSESGLIWTAKEAWVDGVHYTVSWVPNNRGASFEESFDYQGDPELDGEWIEGVKIQEYYINYELAYTKINMNGT